MIFSEPLIRAEFVDRPNRFLTRVRINGDVVASHLPDPGRLTELLIPGAEMRVRQEKGKHRKTRYTTVMVKQETVWVSLISIFANQLAREWITGGVLSGLATAKVERAEIPWKNHRFDFLLTRNGRPYYLEVKSVTWAEQGRAKFPDAVSARATRHVTTLQAMKKEGRDVGILFVCQRSDVEEFVPFHERDPVFARALVQAAEAGVDVYCAAGTVSEYGIRFYREIPVNLTL